MAASACEKTSSKRVRLHPRISFSIPLGMKNAIRHSVVCDCCELYPCLFVAHSAAPRILRRSLVMQMELRFRQPKRGLLCLQKDT
jgi:hypothetical protein